MSARIDNLARAVTEPHVALTGGETVARALRRAEMRGKSLCHSGTPCVILRRSRRILTFPVGGRCRGVAATEEAQI